MDKFYCVVEWESFYKYGQFYAVKPSKVPYRKVYKKNPELILKYFEEKTYFIKSEDKL